MIEAANSSSPQPQEPQVSDTDNNQNQEMQSQAYQQVMDEAEKEYKKVSERITESKDAMKASYEEFMAEAQASASRACKTSIVELSQSFEKAIDSLRNRYGVS